jgi:hypothetical protein
MVAAFVYTFKAEFAKAAGDIADLVGDFASTMWGGVAAIPGEIFGSSGQRQDILDRSDRLRNGGSPGIGRGGAGLTRPGSGLGSIPRGRAPGRRPSAGSRSDAAQRGRTFTPSGRSDAAQRRPGETNTKGARVSGDLAGMHPEFLRRLREMSAATGKAITVRSGFRTNAEQQQLFAKYGPGRAAKPGNSNHEKGLAADISPGREAFGSVAGLYGLAFPISHESWHIEPVGLTSAVAAPGSSDSSSSGSSGPSAAEIRQHNERIGQRRVASIVGGFRPGLRRGGRTIARIGGTISRAERVMARTERIHGLDDEDLTTPEGRLARAGELADLNSQTLDQIDRMRKRKTAIKRQINRRRNLIRRLAAAMRRAPKSQRGPYRTRIRNEQDAIRGLKAELRALGESIADAKIDSQEFERDIVTTLESPAGETPLAELPSGIAKDIALADLTPTTDDDRAALTRARDFWQAELAKGGTDEQVTDAARNLKAILDALAAIEQNTEDTVALMQQRLEAETQRADELARALAVSQAQYPAYMATITDHVNRTLGASVGQGSRALGAAGQVARVG